MPRKRTEDNRHLLLVGGRWYYHRRMPVKLAASGNGLFSRKSLKTKDPVLARKMRDLLEAADDVQWAAQLAGDDLTVAHHNYMAAVNRAEVLGLRYKTVFELLDQNNTPELLKRIETTETARKPDIVAAMGLSEPPKVKISQAFNIYVKEIAPDQIKNKSVGQRADWLRAKRWALDGFIRMCGDMPIREITRDHALTIYNHWRVRVVPTNGDGPRSPSSGNKAIGAMSKLYTDYFRHIGELDRPNPFRGLRFKGEEHQRPSIPVEWIIEKYLQPGPLKGLNHEARGILFVMVETGARPSEIYNLAPNEIVLDHKIPHIKISPRSAWDNPEDRRELKTANSARGLPLVGVALEAMKAHPKGFLRYKDGNPANLSAVFGKFMAAHNLLPSPKHTIYSLRHSMETRLRAIETQDDKRRYILGHTVKDRPNYGEKQLEWLLSEFKQIVLPFDPSIV